METKREPHHQLQFCQLWTTESENKLPPTHWASGSGAWNESCPAPLKKAAASPVWKKRSAPEYVNLYSKHTYSFETDFYNLGNHICDKIVKMNMF